jgi:hypothetical protein
MKEPRTWPQHEALIITIKALNSLHTIAYYLPNVRAGNSGTLLATPSWRNKPSHIFDPLCQRQIDTLTTLKQSRQTTSHQHYSECACVYECLASSFSGRGKPITNDVPVPPSPSTRSPHILLPPRQGPPAMLPPHPTATSTRANTATEKVVHIAQTHKLKAVKLTVLSV